MPEFAQPPKLKTPGDLMASMPAGGPMLPNALGRTPLQSGGVYRVTQLNPNEEAQLQAIGVDTSKGLPSNTGELVQRIARDSQTYIPPASPDFKPTGKYAPVPLSQLPKEKQEQIRAEIALAQEELAKQEQAVTLGEPNAPLEIQSAFDAVQRQVEVYDDRVKEPEAPAPAAKAPLEGAGATTEMHNCPHCGWDLAVPDDVIIEDTDKMVFLHASLGDIPFEKTYNLYDGKLKITFRTLTSFELDAIYKAVVLKVQGDELQLMQERWEVINRFRLALQIKRVERPDRTFDFPDGFTADTNSGAKVFWSALVPNEQALAPMDWIETNVRSQVMRGETLFRVVQKASAHFGRLVSKLEEMADKPDFWDPTGASS